MRVTQWMETDKGASHTQSYDTGKAFVFKICFWFGYVENVEIFQMADFRSNIEQHIKLNIAFEAQ